MEIMDIVDENDRVVGSEEREEIYKKRLRHRIAHVLVFNDRGEMALQVRAKTRSFCPGCFSTTAGGHVLTGETYENAAKREMKEEIGMVLPIEFFKKELYFDKLRPNLEKFFTVFKAYNNGPFEVGDEVEKIDFFEIDDLKKMVEKDEGKFHPELSFIIKKYF